MSIEQVRQQPEYSGREFLEQFGASGSDYQTEEPEGIEEPVNDNNQVELPSGYEFKGVEGSRRLIHTKPDETGGYWLAFEFDILARTRDEDGEGWGTLIAFSDPDGRRHELVVPQSLVASGDGKEVASLLSDRGLTVNVNQEARKRLNEFFALVSVDGRAKQVSRIGWHRDSESGERRFVLPREVIPDRPGGERVIFKGTGAAADFSEQGSLDEWKREVAGYAPGNSRLVLALSAAFAAPLVELVGAESGGVNFRGDSSTGKSSGLHAATSVWGHGKRHAQSWRATANGLEGIAVAHADTLLALDELGQANSADAREAAYLLANGVGKSRAARDGSIRPPARWNCLFLSTGEVSLAQKQAEGKGQPEAKAGQLVRILDVPAEPEGGAGLWERLHGLAGGAGVSAQVSSAAQRVYGVAGRAFLRMLVSEPDGAAARVRQWQDDAAAAWAPQGADGQVSRAAQRFALIGAAGELAAEYGVLPWEAGEAMAGCKACFEAWIADRGSATASHERQQIAERLRLFINRHEKSRFEPIGEDESGEPNGTDRTIVDKAGYKKFHQNDLEFLVSLDVFNREVCQGVDPTQARKHLADLGMIQTTNGRTTVSRRVPGSPGARARFVGVWRSQLEAG